MDVDDEIARLAKRIYTERNEACWEFLAPRPARTGPGY
jgi:hypothetical protein